MSGVVSSYRTKYAVTATCKMALQGDFGEEITDFVRDLHQDLKDAGLWHKVMLGNHDAW